MFIKDFNAADVNQSLGTIDCVRVRSAAFQLYPKDNVTAINAVVEVQGSINEVHWSTFGTMEISSTDATKLADAGNAEFTWPFIRCFVISCDGDATVNVITRI